MKTSPKPTAEPTKSSGGVVEKTVLELFRRFDKEHDEAFILKYVEGLGYDLERILDGLHYALKQPSVKNIYAYLPTILRAEAGKGMAETARKRQEKALKTAADKAKIGALRKNYESLLDEIDATKREIVRQIVATRPEATPEVIGQLTTKYRGSFGITDATTVEAFRENPLLRSLVMHEFRAVFSTEFEGNERLKKSGNAHRKPQSRSQGD